MIAPANRLQHIQEYYFSKKLREIAQMIAEGKPIINLGVGSPDLPPHKKSVDAMVTALNHPKAHQYQGYKGLEELRQAMANFYNKFYQVALNPDSEIYPLIGSKEGIMHISMAFLNTGDAVLLPNPGYPTYASVTKLVGAQPVHYQLDAKHKWLPNFKELYKKDLSKVKLMWINYPHMPTSANANKAFFKDLVAFAKKHQILVVNDNPYSFILNDNPNSFLATPGAKDIGLELNSLSKSFNLSGWRIGMLLGSEQYIEAVLKVKSNVDSGMFYALQKGAVEALNLDEDWFTNLNKIYEERRQLVWQLADALGCTYDTDATGMFVWAKIPNSDSSSVDFSEDILINNNLFITPGSIFGSAGEGYVRFSLCVDVDSLKEALKRVS
jgi:LL-diaminopimelate aminotransferase